jgi:hypothetical protein
MKIINLTKGMFEIVDDEKYDELNQYKWYAQSNGKGRFYAARKTSRKDIGGRKIIYMHQQIMGFPKEEIDHINGNSLDSREINMRICDRTHNNANSKTHCNNTSGFRGVSFDKQKQKWKASVQYNYQYITIGCFDKKEDAAEAYDQKAKELFGEFARCNR